MNRIWVFFYDGDAVYTCSVETKKRFTKKQLIKLQDKALALFKSVPRSQRSKSLPSLRQKQAFNIINNYLDHNQQVIIC